MEHLSIQLDNLPDEILVFILKKLCNVEVLYSLIGINKRLDKLVHDSIFTSDLTLMRTSDKFFYPLSDLILDRFCSEILPNIQHQIESLKIESLSIKRILRATSYPNLYDLGLYNLDVEEAKHLFIDDDSLIDQLKNQILSLNVHINKNEKQVSTDNVNLVVFTQIFIMFNNLKYLEFGISSSLYNNVSFVILPPTVISSTLLELHINVEYFDNCLALLDGRFNQLHTLYIKIFSIRSTNLNVDHTKNLPNLKCFSLRTDRDSNRYDELIVPLLHRMSNLEKLSLYLIICDKNMFVDGNDLKKNIIDKMAYLKKFLFDIRSNISLTNQIYFPTTKDIQHSFKDYQNYEIISCVDYFSEINLSLCHIYTCPYQLNTYHQITNNFPGGLFEYVQEISLFDERPFEHEFFIRLEKSFPFMKKLTLENKKAQKNKQDSSIIKYSHLIDLNLDEAHRDYIKQFIFDTKSCLSNNIYLAVDYHGMKRVTQNFKSNMIRENSKKIGRLNLVGKERIPKYVKQYFPYTNVL